MSYLTRCLFIGNEYNQTAILTNNRFDPEKYAAVGPAWFSATNALGLITNNLAMGATSVQYVILMHVWDFDDNGGFAVSSYSIGRSSNLSSVP
jgi:hypothetical protein